MRYCFPLVVALAFASGASAQTNLEPDTSAFAAEPNGYVATVVMPAVAALKDAFTPDVRVRAIVVPAIRDSYAVGLKERRGKFVIFALKSSQFRKDPTKSCETPIDAKDAQLIVEDWRQMLLRTSYLQGDKRKDVILDGAEYHFSIPSYPPEYWGSPMPTKYGAMEGQTFNPDMETKPRALVTIADTLADYCWLKDKKFLTVANQTANDLFKQLKNNR